MEMKRGAVKKEGSKLINVWIPIPVVTVLDDAIQELDTDRAKFIRQAIREKLQKEKGGQS